MGFHEYEKSSIQQMARKDDEIQCEFNYLFSPGTFYSFSSYKDATPRRYLRFPKIRRTYETSPRLCDYSSRAEIPTEKAENIVLEGFL